MIHPEIRTCFEASFKTPLGQTQSVEALFTALSLHGTNVTPQYQALSAQAGFTPIDKAQLERPFARGSVGAALCHVSDMVSSFYQKTGEIEPHEPTASLLRHIALVGELWRALLNYPRTPSGDLSLHAFIAQQAPNKASALALTAWLGRVAFTDPEAMKPVYDALTCGWQDGARLPSFLEVDWHGLLDMPVETARTHLRLDIPDTRPLGCAPLPSKSLKATSLSDGFPEHLWALINAPEKATDPYQITSTVAAFGNGFDTAYSDAVERMVLSFEGLKEITSTPIPQTVKIETLRDMPEGSLGQTFYRLITDNNFDVEVLDPASLFGAAQPDMPPVEWMNRRILQLHDVFHLVAGYKQIGEDEIGISGFQLAQIGQPYSAWFIAAVSLISTLYFPAGLAPILELSFSGWKHGRETRPLILVDWESLWGEQISTIRQTYQISPFASGATEFPSVAAD